VGTDRTGILLVVAALIVGASIVAGALLIRSSVRDATEQVSGLRAELADAGRRPSAGEQTARAGRPDPGRRYSVATEDSPAMGPEDAKVAIVEFIDFQCPFCSRVNATLERVRDRYGKDVRVVFKHLPLRMHPRAPAAHAAAEAAHRQGRFWEMHDKIFSNQREMSPQKYVEYAGELGLDLEQFQSDVASASVKSRVDADAAEAARLGITGTPGFLINGRFLSGARPFESFQAVIDEELGRG
jgi:protein-disulfide isomerase